MQAMAMVLFGFAGHAVHPLGQITLPLTLGDESGQRTSMAPFLVVDASSAYNVILERLFLSTFMVVASPYH